jgi:guanylate kinase
MWVEGWGHLPGQLVVVSGPSGSGKSSVVRAALGRGALNARLSVSATTRDRRPGEAHGVDYHFMTVEEFRKVQAEGGLLESAEYNANLYGTPARPVYEELADGRSVILEIEVQGALQVRSSAPTSVFVFIKAPSFKVLEQRLRGRGTETEDVILRRLRTARAELAEAHWYDHVLINDEFERCVDDFIRLLRENGCGG